MRTHSTAVSGRPNSKDSTSRWPYLETRLSAPWNMKASFLVRSESSPRTTSCSEKATTGSRFEDWLQAFVSELSVSG